MPGRKTKLSVEISIHNAQRRVRLSRSRMAAFAKRALEICRQIPASRPWPAEEISVVFVSDRTIAAVHKQFMSIPGPTDVITFQHGEIVISAETARRQARQFGTSLERELRLYLVHGLLHLRGYDDKTKRGAETMRRLQEKVLRRLDREGTV